jgi:phosphoenolpyruvate synthase/pyruvate phosphate dikinase
MSETQSKRLDRIEGKIDKLHEGFVSLARMEERIVSLFKNNEAIDKQIAQIEKSFNKRIDSLETIVKDQAEIIRTNAQVTSRITKLFWAAIAAIPAGWIGLIFYMLRDSI